MPVTKSCFYFFVIHHCKKSLSSLHIFVHHCTFCASLHVKTSSDQYRAWPTTPLVITIIVQIVIPLINSRACFKKNSWLHILTERFPSSLLWPKLWKKIFYFISKKFWWPFLVIDPKSSCFQYFFSTFHNKTPYFSLHFSFSSLKNSADLFKIMLNIPIF